MATRRVMASGLGNIAGNERGGQGFPGVQGNIQPDDALVRGSTRRLLQGADRPLQAPAQRSRAGRTAAAVRCRKDPESANCANHFGNGRIAGSADRSPAMTACRESPTPPLGSANLLAATASYFAILAIGRIPIMQSGANPRPMSRLRLTTRGWYENYSPSEHDLHIRRRGSPCESPGRASAAARSVPCRLAEDRVAPDGAACALASLASVRVGSVDVEEGAQCARIRSRGSRRALRERRGMSAIGSAAARASVILAGNRARQPSAPSTTKWTTPADQLTTSGPADSSGSFTTIARPAQKGLAFRSASSIVSRQTRRA